MDGVTYDTIASHFPINADPFAACSRAHSVRWRSRRLKVLRRFVREMVIACDASLRFLKKPTGAPPKSIGSLELQGFPQSRGAQKRHWGSGGQEA